jgi:O-antigen/teichoic acid export membrane protein
VAAYRIITKLLNTAVLFYLLFNDYGLVAIAVLQLVTGIVSNLFFFYMARSVYRELQIAPSYISRDVMKELFHFSSWAFLIDINRMLKERIDLFFIGGFVSLAAVSIYYVPVRLVEYTLQLLYKALNLSLPILTGNSSKGEPEKFRANLILFNRINVYFAVLTFFFFLLYGKSILFYWMGAEFDSEAAYLILLVLMGARLSALSSNGFNNALYAQAKHKVIAYINFMEAIATAILLTVFLVLADKGPLGAAAAIAIPLCLGRLLLLPWWALRILAINNGAALVWQSYRPLLLLAAGCAVYSLMPLAKQLTWAHLVYGIVCLVAVLIYAAVELQAREREYLRSMFNKLGGKLSKS